jgi:hypothetical protein
MGHLYRSDKQRLNNVYCFFQEIEKNFEINEKRGKTF